MPGHLVLREACAGVEMKGVSGSEAERLLEGVDADFDAVDVDFTGVTDVGQGFVDELLQVWPSAQLGEAVNQEPGRGVYGSPRARGA
jgi:hypothetical protein